MFFFCCCSVVVTRYPWIIQRGQYAQKHHSQVPVKWGPNASDFDQTLGMYTVTLAGCVLCGLLVFNHWHVCWQKLQYCCLFVRGCRVLPLIIFLLSHQSWSKKSYRKTKKIGISVQQETVFFLYVATWSFSKFGWFNCSAIVKKVEVSTITFNSSQVFFYFFFLYFVHRISLG